MTRDHVLRTDEERPLLIRPIREQPGDAAIDHNVGIALAKAEIMDADVTRTLPMNGGRNTVNFSKVGDHQGRETIHYRIRFTDFKFAICIGRDQKIAASLRKRIKRDGRVAGKGIRKAHASHGMAVADTGTGIHDYSDMGAS